MQHRDWWFLLSWGVMRSGSGYATSLGRRNTECRELSVHAACTAEAGAALLQVTGPYTWVRALLPDGIGSYDMSVFQVDYHLL